jgi:nitrogen-specific signal transduction histidine kinase
MYTNDAKSLSVSLECVIDNLPTAVIVMDSDTCIVMANRMAAFFTNRTRDDFVGMKGGEAFHCVHAADDPRGCGFGPHCQSCQVRKTVMTTLAAKSNRAFVDAELEMLEAGKRIFRLSTTYLAESGCVLLALEDITEQKNLEAERLARSKLLAAMQTAGAVCHEINQPLQVICSHLDMFEIKHVQGVPCDGSHFNAIRDQVDKLAEITEKLQNIKRFAEKEYTQGTDILDIDKSSAA